MISPIWSDSSAWRPVQTEGGSLPLAGIRYKRPGAGGRDAARCFVGSQKSGIMIMVGGIVHVTVEYVAQTVSLRMGWLRVGMIVPGGFFVM